MDSGDLPLLVDHAHEDDWHEVLVSFMAHADLQKRDQLLEGLLKGNTTAQQDRHVRDPMHLVAAACLEQADVVDTDATPRPTPESPGRHWWRHNGSLSRRVPTLARLCQRASLGARAA